MVTEEFHRATGRSVWLGKDLSLTPDWIYHLPREALAEIDGCLQKLRKNGKKLEDIGKQDFPFETIGDEIDSFKQELATGRGFFNLRGIPSEKYSDDELGMSLPGLAIASARHETQYTRLFRS